MCAWKRRRQKPRNGVQAVTVDQLLADPAIQIVINLTVPVAHAPVSLQIVEAFESIAPFSASRDAHHQRKIKAWIIEEIDSLV